MGFFDGGAQAGIGGDGQRIKPGSYPRLMVDSCKVVNGHHGLKYIVFLVPLEAGTQAGEQPDGKKYEPNPVDVGGDWGARIDGPQAKSGKAEVNAFAAALLGTDDLVEIERQVNESVTPEQPWKGKEIGANIFLKRTNNGYFMTKGQWEHRGTESGSVRAAAPVPPATPAAPPPAPAAKPFPPAPWEEYQKGWFHDGQGNAKSEAELRAM